MSSTLTPTRTPGVAANTRFPQNDELCAITGPGVAGAGAAVVFAGGATPVSRWSWL
jgi:hypothetical protein